MARLTDIMKEEDPCWKGYQQIGMKKKGGKEVPNCVPESVELDESEFSPMGYAQKVVNGKLSFLDALKDSQMRAVDLLKLVKKIDKNYNPKFESVNEEESPEEVLKGLNEMAMGNLERIEDYAEMISDRMEQGQQLESWMFSEITQALNGLNSVHDAMDGKDGIKEAELPKAMIPGPIKAKLTQAIDKIKDTNLSYTQKLQVISKIIDSLGIDKKELTKISTRLKGTLESVNEGHFGDIDIIANEAKDFRDFVKEFYKEYKDFPKTKDSIKWLEGIYKGRSKMEGLDKDGLERVAQGLPQTEEEPISENALSDLENRLKSHDWWYAYSDDSRKYNRGESNWSEITKMVKGMKGNKEAEKLWNKYAPKDFGYSFKKLSETQLDEGMFKIGIKHITPLIPTGYAPNDPKYKMDLKILRTMLNNFYQERGYEKVILPSF